jgi:polysaccharide chain length determinant protein (PEP-CTERM system associated)
VNDNPESQQTIEEQIESRALLLAVIDHLHLYGDRQSNLTPDQKVKKMIKALKIEMVRNPGSGVVYAFKVSFQSPSPGLAQQVSAELSSRFIAENRRQLQLKSEDTTALMKQQLEDARKGLAEQETRLREFRSAHEGELPAQEAGNLQMLSGLQAQLQTEQDALNTARQQRIYYQSMIDQYRGLPQTPEGAGLPAEEAALDQQLVTMRGQLVELRARYTERHPAVQNLLAEIARTESLRREIANTVASAQKKEPAAGNSTINIAENFTVSAQLAQLQSQLEANQTEIANRGQDVAQLKARIQQYQQRLSAEPDSAAQFAELSRGYDQSQANFNELLKKSNESELANSMENMQESQPFRILEPPGLPQKPAFPNPLLFCGMGLAFGMVAGVAAVLILELLDDRLHSEQQIEALLPVAVLAEVPEIRCPEEELQARRQIRRGWSVAAGIAVLIAAASLFSYLHA